MIDYVKGILAEKELSTVAVEAHGVGYEVVIPLSTYERLPAIGSEVKLYTHYHVREDLQKLYGFMSKAERELFRELISVSSVGPKTAIGILSKISAEELIRCVTLGDSSRLTKVPGVGAKTAQRLVMELRGKFKGSASDTSVPLPSGTPAKAASPAGREAFEALLSLGYNEKQVSRAIERVKEVLAGSDAPVEEWIKKALQVI